MMPSASLFSKILSHLSAQLRFAAKLLKNLKSEAEVHHLLTTLK